MLTVVRVNGNWYVIIWMRQSNIVKIMMETRNQFHPWERVVLGGGTRSRESTDVKLLKSLSLQIEERDWVTSPVKGRETDDTRSMLPWRSVTGKRITYVTCPGIAHKAGATTCDEEGVDVK
tara:strand:+ start:214 stop:576 length:363 start_codon:yes stop_codon:yes gene_type:complete